MSHLMVVLSNALPAHEDEFNSWYQDVHVHQLVDLADGFDSAQRFVRTELPSGVEHPYKYLAIYEVSDPEQAQAQLDHLQQERQEAEAAGRQPRLTASRGMAPDALVGFFTTLGPRVTPRREPSEPASRQES